MPTKQQLGHRAYLVGDWLKRARAMRHGWAGYMGLIEELHFLAAFVDRMEGEAMIDATHAYHRNVVRHYLTAHGVFDSA